MTDLEGIKKRLAIRRSELGWTQKELGERSGVGGQLSHWLNGERKAELESWEKVAEAAGRANTASSSTPSRPKPAR